MNSKQETIYSLIFQSGIKSSIVNLLTLSRIILSPLLLILLFNDYSSFKWVLLFAFMTDALDGFLARYWKVTTKLGARMDSVADDFLFSVALIAILYMHSAIFTDNIFILSLLIFILLFKILFLWYKHNTIISAMHTYLTKGAAFFQAVFFIHCIFFGPRTDIFYVTSIITMLAMVEEIIIIYLLKKLRQNVRGLFFYNNL